LLKLGNCIVDRDSDGFAHGQESKMAVWKLFIAICWWFREGF
jgi:hypothetical protein